MVLEHCKAKFTILKATRGAWVPGVAVCLKSSSLYPLLGIHQQTIPRISGSALQICKKMTKICLPSTFGGPDCNHMLI